MKHAIELFYRIALLVIILIIWWFVLNASLSNVMNLSIIVGGVLLTFPIVWIGRKILDRHQTMGRAVWTTTFVHFGLDTHPVYTCIAFFRESL